MSRVRRLDAALVPMVLVVFAGVSGPAPAAADAGHVYSTERNGLSYALVSPGSQVTFSDVHEKDTHERIRRVLDTAERDALWFSLNGRDYLVSEPRMVERAKEIVQPMRELGREQGRLGARQGGLGREQGRLGRQQGELARRQAALASRLGHEARAARGGSRARASTAIEREIAELAARQGALGREQAALGGAQSELGERQRRLGEEQREASRRAQAEMRRLADDAIARGIARPVGEHGPQ